MNKTTAYITLIILILSVVIYFADAPERILGYSDALESEVNAVPFSVARNTTTTHYAGEGEVSYTFNASRLEHYREEKNQGKVFTIVEKPELIIYEDEEPWFVQAEKGKLSSSSELIELWSKVMVKHTNIEGITTTIQTEKLIIDPVSRLANTAEPVKISSDRVEITGVGMKADMVAKKLNLLSEVLGHYEPN